MKIFTPIACCALAVGAGAAQAVEEKPQYSPPPAVPNIMVGGVYDENGVADNIARKISYDWRNFENVSKEYPADAAAAKRTARVRVKVGIGGDDSIVYCTPIKVEKDEALAAGACDIIRKYGKFTHAIDTSGAPVTSDAMMMVDWDIRPAIFAPPAPPPAPRWLETDGGQKRGWFDPVSTQPNAQLVQEPDWNRFAINDKKAPKKATSLATITLGPDGHVRDCTIVGGSGHEGIDKASCDGLLQAEYGNTTSYSPNYPPGLALRVEWKGKNAKASVPTTGPQYPVMLAPVIVQPSLKPEGFETPKWNTSFQISIGPKDKMTRCLILRTTGSDAVDASICALMRAQGKFKSARDVFDRPTTSGMYLNVDWSKMVINPPYDNYNR